jgi:hypothetical protein
MRYVMFTCLSPEDVEAWRNWTPDEQAADVDRHTAWFRKFGDKVVGGEELDEPLQARRRAAGRGPGVRVGWGVGFVSRRRTPDSPLCPPAATRR